jgi:endonuclease/exonuclease/phosphatase family metal-dependent hydrolase
MLRVQWQLLAFVFFWGLTPWAMQAQEPIPGEVSHIRALTFNIRYDNPGDGQNGWKHRRDGVAKLIEDQKVDVAGLQEVVANQLDDLRERLPDYEFLGVGREDGKRKGEFSPLLVRKEAFEVIASGTFWLSPTPDKPGSQGWDAALPRICTWAQLHSRQPGRDDFLAASTHFDHKGEEARLESAHLIRKQLAEIQSARKIAGGMIVMGDFNCTVNDPPYLAIMDNEDGAGPAWFDSHDAEGVLRAGPDSTWNGFKEIAPGQRIDFIFFQDQKPQRHEVIDARIGERFLSDHLPVLVVFK